MSQDQISIVHLFCCLTTEAEKYANESNKFLGSAVFKHSMGDGRAQEGTETETQQRNQTVRM